MLRTKGLASTRSHNERRRNVVSQEILADGWEKVETISTTRHQSSEHEHCLAIRQRANYM